MVTFFFRRMDIVSTAYSWNGVCLNLTSEIDRRPHSVSDFIINLAFNAYLRYLSDNFDDKRNLIAEI